MYYCVSSYLQLKVPLPCINTVGLLCSENAEPLSRHNAEVRLICWKKGRQGGRGGRVSNLMSNLMDIIIFYNQGNNFPQKITVKIEKLKIIVIQ